MLYHWAKNSDPSAVKSQWSLKDLSIDAVIMVVQRWPFRFVMTVSSQSTSYASVALTSNPILAHI